MEVIKECTREKSKKDGACRGQASRPRLCPPLFPSSFHQKMLHEIPKCCPEEFLEFCTLTPPVFITPLPEDEQPFKHGGMRSESTVLQISAKELKKKKREREEGKMIKKKKKIERKKYMNKSSLVLFSCT